MRTYLLPALLLFTCGLPGTLGQPGPGSPASQAYVDSVFTDLLPALEKQQDADGIFHHLDAAFRIKDGERSWTEAYDLLGWKLHYAGLFNRFDASCETLEQAGRFLEDHAADFDPGVLQENRRDIRLRTAQYYYETGNWLAATDYYREIRQELGGLPEKREVDWYNLANSNLYLGVMARSKGDYEAAEAFFLEALECQRQYRDPEEKARGHALLHKHLGDLLLLKKEPPRSAEHYEKAIDAYGRLVAGGAPGDGTYERNLRGLTTSLLGLSRLEKTNGRFDRALAALDLAEKTDELKDEVAQGFGEVYAAARDHERAATYFDRALQLRTGLYGERHYKTAQTLSARGDLLLDRGDPREALQFYQRSLIALADGFADTDPARNPTAFHQTFISRDLPGVFARKMEALLRLHRSGQRDRNYLMLARDAGAAAVAVLDSLKSSPVKSEEDKHRLLDESYAVYEKNLHVAAALGPDFYEEAFSVMEKSRSIILLEAFQNANARHLAGIPDSLLEKEIRLKHELSLLEERLQKAGADETGTTRMKLRIARLQADYRNLIAGFQRTSPRYYQAKYALGTPGIDRVRRELLEEGQALLEYFVGDSSIFVLVITHDDLKLKEIKKSFPLDDWVAGLLEGVYAGNPARRSGLSYGEGSRQYASYAWLIYQHLVAPVADGLPEKLLVVPDGALGYVPFDALLTAELTGGFTAFRQHPYLMNGHEISYAYSAALLEEMKKMEIRTAGVLAVAPEFRNAPATLAVRGSGLPLDSLTHNQEEARSVHAAVGRGKVLVGLQATRQAFIRDAADYSILHIATHGMLNPAQSYFSFLAFTPGPGGGDSSQLYVRDLYNLRLNAAMAVLSACQTGLGQMKRGEGIISLAYGMFYSGCQSVVMTLWSVDETSTTQIMKNFYTGLSGRHLTKSAALRSAKQAYLEDQADDFRSHPFFWAAFTPVGDMRALFPGRPWIWLLVGVGVAGLGFWAWKRIFRAETQV
jgi:CHAT domain-containing protein/tetratricopeptide (TPR) repeat protein